jgi:hypothetical protein
MRGRKPNEIIDHIRESSSYRPLPRCKIDNDLGSNRRNSHNAQPLEDYTQRAVTWGGHIWMHGDPCGCKYSGETAPDNVGQAPVGVQIVAGCDGCQSMQSMWVAALAQDEAGCED